MEFPLVSVLTPCYNMEAYIHRLLDSVLAQTYPSIEMFVIDDGSSDHSVDVVNGYLDKFEQKGYRLKCIIQNHGGQSNAIKRGLSLITGKYLVWPDADDYYASELAIAEMVKCLEESTYEFKMVRTQERIIEDGTFKEIKIRGIDAKEEEGLSLFEDCLYGRNGFYFVSGAYMADIQALKEMTRFDIFTNPEAGQNWQLLLPVLYKYRCKTILKPYYNVVRRKGSHSRMGSTEFEAFEKRKWIYYLTQTETLKRIPGISNTKLIEYERNLKLFYAHLLFRRSLSFNQMSKTEKYKKILEDNHAITQIERLLFLINIIPGLLPLIAKLRRRFSYV